MSEVEETEDERKRKIQLLAAIRDKDHREALRLLQAGTGVDYRDMTGSYPIHYAATEGYDDIIEVLLQKGANVMAWNNNGRTALHQAAMHGHARSLVTLVAGGAVVRALDEKGCLALEYAIHHKHVVVVELLCLFGSEPLLQDWSWMGPNINKKKAEYAMAKILQNQIRLIPAYRHTGVIFDVTRVTPEEGPLIHLEKTGVQMKVVEGQERYYLYLCQTEEAYGSPPPLGPDEEAFGHLLECQTWGPRVKTITLTVTVDRVLRQTEEIVLRVDTSTGSVDHVEMQEVDGVGITIVTLTVPLKHTGMTYFAMASREKKQVFQISEEAVVLKPESEPEAEIDIPAGTFDSGEISVKFVDTTEVPDEADEPGETDQGKSGEEAVLMTSILDLSTTDGQQPSHDIQMKLPVTIKDPSEAIVVLTTSNPDPNLEEWAWDEIPAEVDDTGKAVFKISHFSIFTGTSKPILAANPENVKGEIRKTFLKLRRVEFLLAVKTPELDETKTDMIIICGTQRKVKLAKKEKKFDKSYTWFSLESDTQLLEVPEGQVFQIVIRGNLKERSDDDNIKLIFKSSSQVSSHAMEVVSTTTDSLELSGEVDILKETKSLGPDRVESVTVGCFPFTRHTEETMMKSQIWETNTEKLCTIPFTTTLTQRDPEPVPDYSNFSTDPEAEPDPYLNFSSAPYEAGPLQQVSWTKLKLAICHLSFDESKHLGFQLGLKHGQMKKVMDDTMDDKDLGMNVVKRWHLLLAGNDKVSQLKGALEAIGRRDLIQMINQ